MALAAAALVLGVIAEVFAGRSDRKFNGQVVDLLPRADELPGWTRAIRPLAETLEMQRAVAEVLNFDDAAYVDYSSPQMRVSVYIAYWSPGKMSHRLIAGHTPDVCWVDAGWIPQETGVETEALGKDASHSLAFERRVFELRGTLEHVVFCHLVDGRPTSYGTGGLPPWYAIFSDILQKRSRQKEEQFFIRVSSDRPFREFDQALPVRLVMERLGKLVPMERSRAM
jgi:hypothetical protein